MLTPRSRTDDCRRHRMHRNRRPTLSPRIRIALLRNSALPEHLLLHRNHKIDNHHRRAINYDNPNAHNSKHHSFDLNDRDVAIAYCNDAGLQVYVTPILSTKDKGTDI